MLQVQHFNLSVREVRERTVQYRTAVLPYCYITEANVCVHRLSHVPICVELPQPILSKNRCDRRSLKALLG